MEKKRSEGNEARGTARTRDLLCDDDKQTEKREKSPAHIKIAQITKKKNSANLVFSSLFCFSRPIGGEIKI
jgi:hypothetical protein